MTIELDPAARAKGGRVTEPEIPMSAAILIDRNGVLAAIEAADSSESCQESGDFEGQRVCHSVIRALAAMTDVAAEVTH
jgi:hypothetical protein